MVGNTTSTKMESGFNRREFLKGAILGVAGMMVVPATFGVAGCSSEDSGGTATDPAKQVAALGDSSEKLVSGDFVAPGTEMTLDELNEKRREYVGAQTEYVCEDGTIIPEIYVKLRALMNSYSFGFGSELHDHCFDEFIYLFSEEEAQAYLEMPYGIEFTATDFAVQASRNEDDCIKLCENLAQRCLLRRVHRGGVSYYHHMAMAYGMWEYIACGDYEPKYTEVHSVVWGNDVAANKLGSYTPFYYTVPVNRDIVTDENLYPYDDWERIIERNTVFGICPCQCQRLGLGSVPDSDVLLERCVVLGSNAEYAISTGGAREATKEEIIEHIRSCVDEGMVIEKVWTKEPEVICLCHKDVCGIQSAYQALGDDFAQFNTHGYISHYQLDYDKDNCIGCGTCMGRCPAKAITMQDGHPVVNASCQSCGQCALVCPQGVRTLSMKDLSKFPDLSENLLDDYNVKAMFRFAHDMI